MRVGRMRGGSGHQQQRGVAGLAGPGLSRAAAGRHAAGSGGGATSPSQRPRPSLASPPPRAPGSAAPQSAKTAGRGRGGVVGVAGGLSCPPHSGLHRPPLQSLRSRPSLAWRRIPAAGEFGPDGEWGDLLVGRRGLVGLRLGRRQHGPDRLPGGAEQADLLHRGQHQRVRVRDQAAGGLPRPVGLVRLVRLAAERCRAAAEEEPLPAVWGVPGAGPPVHQP